MRTSKPKTHNVCLFPLTHELENGRHVHWRLPSHSLKRSSSNRKHQCQALSHTLIPIFTQTFFFLIFTHIFFCELQTLESQQQNQSSSRCFRQSSSQQQMQSSPAANLEEDVCAHGFAVSDDWFLVFIASIPAVQLHTPVHEQFHQDKSLSISLSFHARMHACTHAHAHTHMCMSSSIQI